MGFRPVPREREMANGDGAIIQIRNLALGFGERVILSEIHLEVRAGEFWFFLGPNGMGKSTLLQALLGVIKPRGGEIWWDRDRVPVQARGFVPQRCELSPTLEISVREFVSLGLVGLRVDRAERERRLDWALDRMGLRDLARRSHGSLSGGQRQRALGARSLIRRPSVLLLDEPINNLDLPTAEAFLQSLAALNQDEGITLLFVTHDLLMAARFATHVALFHHGHLHAGPAAEILQPEALEEAFGVPVEICELSGGPVAVHRHSREACR